LGSARQAKATLLGQADGELGLNDQDRKDGRRQKGQGGQRPGGARPAGSDAFSHRPPAQPDRERCSKSQRGKNG